MVHVLVMINANREVAILLREGSVSCNEPDEKLSALGGKLSKNLSHLRPSLDSTRLHQHKVLQELRSKVALTELLILQKL